MWSLDYQGRAPFFDFPPLWAVAWGDDIYGLWADLCINGVIQRMRWIEPSGPDGFWMGSPKQERDRINEKGVRDWANDSEHEPLHVQVENGFWLADTPCTQALWQAVTGTNPSYFSVGADAPMRPVEHVSWDVVMRDFVGPMTQTAEWGVRERVYLPSEVEWEYAARAGTRTAYWWGDIWDDQRGNADVTGERQWGGAEGTNPVKRYQPNPWGLYDMHGNVWEWCADAWQACRNVPATQPDDALRVMRGGSWFYLPVYARAAFRNGKHRRNAFQFQGFRFALKAPVGPQEE